MGILDFVTFFPPPSSAHCFRNKGAVVSWTQIIKIEHIFPIKLRQADHLLMKNLASVRHEKIVIKLL